MQSLLGSYFQFAIRLHESEKKFFILTPIGVTSNDKIVYMWLLQLVRFLNETKR